MKLFVAKDKNGKVYAYQKEPKKYEGEWLAEVVDGIINLSGEELPKWLDPSWDDNFPIEVELEFKKPKSL